MKHPTALHLMLEKAKHAFVNSDSAFPKVDPFKLLLAFVQGTGDLFDPELRSQVALICQQKDVAGYLELAGSLNALSKNYDADMDPELVKGHRVLCSFLKKYPFSASESPYDTKAVAIAKWRQAEEQCGDTNARLSQIKAAGFLPEWVPHAQRFIVETIGELASDDIMKMLSLGHHSKGTCTETPFDSSSPYFKYDVENPMVTPDARVYMKAALSLNNKWLSELSRKQGDKYCCVSRPHYESEVCDTALRLQQHERISFVDKDASSMRPIGIGNSCNMYLQLGVKTHMQKCLLRAGFDLTNQQHNRHLAYLGSVEGMIALSCPDQDGNQRSTVDLANASDTNALELSSLLLPYKWFSFLSDLRHPTGMLGEEIITYNKMSAMGNGFTFPLESLIFASILYGVYAQNGWAWDTDDIAVYGDDIICHKFAVPDLFTALEWSGFSMNTEKSFISGSFKESCGADYFQGINVRPIYLKRCINSAKDAYHVANTVLPQTLDVNSQVSAGYRAIYQAIYVILKDVGPVLYGPLVDAYSHDGNGLVWAAPETGLCVPLVFARKQWFAPFPSMSNLLYLYHKTPYFRKAPKRMRNDAVTAMLQNPNPLVFVPIQEQRSLAAKNQNAELILLCTLDSHREEVDVEHDKYQHSYVDMLSNGVIRPRIKRGPKYAFKVRECPSWDGHSSALFEHHPLVFEQSLLNNV